MSSLRPHVTVVGLGPAGSDFLSSAVAALMHEAPRTILRTARHPAAQGFESYESFDGLYEAADTFDQLYRDMVEVLVEAARAQAPNPIVYAVPGSPYVAERSVELLRADDRVEVATVPALSFLDLAWDRLGIDPLAVAVRLIDAEQLVSLANPGPGPFLVAQCWSQALLSGIKLMVDTDEEAALPQVTILHHLGLDDEEVRTVRWWDLDREMTPDHLTSLYINPRKVHPNAQGEMARLEELVRTLRAECPWDRVQTHSSLLPHLVEECYEVLDALSVVASDTSQAGPTEFAHLEEELGDLLFQIVFHARLAEEKGHFTLADVAHGVHEKLVHRHPHVFSDVSADTPDQVVSNWEAIKKEEKGRSSVTEGIPTHLPSLMLTSKLQRKAHSVELSGSERRGELVHLVTKLQDQTQTGDHADTDAPLAGRGETEELVGQLLFDIVDLARRAGVDAEQALRARAMEYRERIVAAETARTPRV